MAAKVEDAVLRTTYNAAVKKYGATSKQALDSRAKLNADRQSKGLAVNDLGIGKSSNGTGVSNAPVVTPSGGPNPSGVTVSPKGVPSSNLVPQVTTTANQDVNKTFNLNNPNDVTDANGNTRTIVTDPVTGETKIVNKAGGTLSSTQTAFGNAVTNFDNNGAGDRSKATDASYNYVTKNYGAQKQKEVSDATQSLANRGIPFSTDPNSQWQQQLKLIDDKYQGLDDQAKNQAQVEGNAAYQADYQGVQALGSTLAGQQPNMPAYAGGTSNVTSSFLDAVKTMSASEAAAYGIDQDTFTKLQQVAASKSNAALAASTSTANNIRSNANKGDTGDVITQYGR